MVNIKKSNDLRSIVLKVTYLSLFCLVIASHAWAQSGKDYKLPNIDLSHWKVTLPIGDKKPIEVSPPEILGYATNAELKPFMYNDSTDGSLVFYTYPGATTGNTKYSRTELREQMVPGDNNTNWTFAQGGRMKGTLSVPDISKKADGKFDRTIIMQIHGRLSNEQKELIGQKDNNAPPILKIYWHNGYVRVKTKVLKDINATGKAILATDAWGDDEGYNFPQYVGHEPFTLEVLVTEGRMEIKLNDGKPKVYENIHMRKWGVFENYFKAGNYFTSLDPKAYAYVKYYALEVDHNVQAPVKVEKKKKKKKEKSSKVRILNGGFDQAGEQEYRDHWINKSLGGTVQITSKPVQAGEKAGKLPATGDRIAYQLVSVEKNKDYELSFYYTLKTSPKGALRATILAGDVNSKAQIENATIVSEVFDNQSANNEYVRAEVKFNSGDNDNIGILMANENVECRFDSFQIRESK
ncbi:polysaccharide lyase family 7 protein [Reichenbachiella carrageenanivorans]|uniref:Polysaccharide lyase family 7 protein n=1 Tax=Reichenbachiella carrageenanivorans TaxID=2979869 RepID=A0ABY6CWH6_9BACT|nr:polysaccharide lyase family 7 protein [Reichenbachiella carrageenanivorans]UXX78269.1 polysaccharide lyase family 7 protein [Reichenbachiella carrageenanivorans]